MRQTILDRVGKVCIPPSQISYIDLPKNGKRAKIFLEKLPVPIIEHRSYVLKIIRSKTAPGRSFVLKNSDLPIIQEKFQTSAKIRITTEEIGHPSISLFNVNKTQIADAIYRKEFSKLSLCEAGAIVMDNSLWSYQKEGWRLVVTDKYNIIALNGTDGTTTIGSEICSIA